MTGKQELDKPRFGLFESICGQSFKGRPTAVLAIIHSRKANTGDDVTGSILLVQTEFGWGLPQGKVIEADATIGSHAKPLSF